MKNRTHRKLITALALAISACAAHASFPVGGNNFANAGFIPALNTNDASDVTNNTGFTAETGEPSALVRGARTAWWRWTAVESGWCVVDTFESGPPPSVAVSDTVLGVFTGSAVNTLTQVGVNDNASGSGYSRVTFFASAGTTYAFGVDTIVATEVGQIVLRHRFFKPAKARHIGTWSIELAKGRSGLLDFSTTASGLVTGKLIAGTKAMPFKGYANVDGSFRAVIPQPPAQGEVFAAPFVVDVDSAPNSDKSMGFTVSRGASEASGFASRAAVFTTQAPHALARYFTASLSHTAPLGSGFFTAKVSPLGKVAFAGRFGDGSPFAAGGTLCQTNTAQFHKVPFAPSANGGRSQFIAQPEFFETAVDFINGSSVFFRAPGTGPFLPAGVQQTFVPIGGGEYKKPAAGQRAHLVASMGVGKFTATAAAGESAGFVENLALSTSNAFTFTSPARKPVLKLNTTTGLVTGSIQDPIGSPRKIYGIVTGGGVSTLQGYMTGATAPVRFSIAP